MTVSMGLSGLDSLSGKGGNDKLYGGKDSDRLDGGAGNDSLIGYRGDDRLEGGKGDDYLNGCEGSDTYIFHAGDGNDTIVDYDPDHIGSDQLILSGISPVNVAVEPISGVTSATLYGYNAGTLWKGYKISVVGTDDSISVRFWLDDTETPSHGIEIITFGDGTEWTSTNIQDILVSNATENEDTIFGFSRPDTIVGPWWGRLP